MKSVEVTIAQTGQLQIEAAGFSGTDCEKATAFLETALGELQVKQRKPEFFQRNRRTRQQKAGL